MLRKSQPTLKRSHFLSIAITGLIAVTVSSISNSSQNSREMSWFEQQKSVIVTVNSNRPTEDKASDYGDLDRDDGSRAANITDYLVAVVDTSTEDEKAPDYGDTDQEDGSYSERARNTLSS